MGDNILNKYQDLYLFLKNNCGDISNLKLNYDRNTFYLEIVGVFKNNIISFTYEIDDSLFVIYYGDKSNLDLLLPVVLKNFNYKYILKSSNNESGVSCITFTNFKENYLDKFLTNYVNVDNERDASASKNKVFKK